MPLTNCEQPSARLSVCVVNNRNVCCLPCLFVRPRSLDCSWHAQRPHPAALLCTHQHHSFFSSNSVSFLPSTERPMSLRCWDISRWTAPVVGASRVHCQLLICLRAKSRCWKLDVSPPFSCWCPFCQSELTTRLSPWWQPNDRWHQCDGERLVVYLMCASGHRCSDWPGNYDETIAATAAFWGFDSCIRLEGAQRCLADSEISSNGQRWTW